MGSPLTIGLADAPSRRRRSWYCVETAIPTRLALRATPGDSVSSIFLSCVWPSLCWRIVVFHKEIVSSKQRRVCVSFGPLISPAASDRHLRQWHPAWCGGCGGRVAEERVVLLRRVGWIVRAERTQRRCSVSWCMFCPEPPVLMGKTQSSHGSSGSSVKKALRCPITHLMQPPARMILPSTAVAEASCRGRVIGFPVDQLELLTL